MNLAKANMRFHFRPFPGLTIFTVISLAILIALGTWQYQRLQWKTALLIDVEQAVTAPPLRSLSKTGFEITNSVPVDFRRIEFEAEILPDQMPFLVYSRDKMELKWRPFYVAKDSGLNRTGKRSYVAMSPVPDIERETIKPSKSEVLKLAGYVRLWRQPERGSVESTPELNRWFGFDPLQETASWENGLNGMYVNTPIDTSFYIDVVAGVTSADVLPVKRPQIRNNHLDYMLTWYGLAVALFIIYLILHAQRGRLGFRKP